MRKDQIKLSAEFKSQTTKAIIAIVFFVLVYLLILGLAVALTAFAVIGGIALVAAVTHFITLAIGLGLVSLGVFVLIFLLKFMFGSHKTDRSHLRELLREEEPMLFELIEDIAREVGTSSPKRVYIAADVNASVFYDSNFWSMFLPVRKNLTIGMGLVNSVTTSELKAILSHEFGHFAQRTMKVGSYVYNVNQVIFNMVYDDESYNKLLQKWGEASWYFAIFQQLALSLINGVRWVLRKLYGVVNKSYMALSREMEFHADEIASVITGYDPLKSSLLRMPLADYSYGEVLRFYEGKIPGNKRSTNIYAEQSMVMEWSAGEKGIVMVEGIPQVSGAEWSKFNKSKLVIKDQWASHPGHEERIERMERTGMKAATIDYTPAGNLFKNLTVLQEEMTNRVFSQVVYPGEVKHIAPEEFGESYFSDVRSNAFPALYNGYYDNRNPPLLEVESIPHYADTELEVLFSDETLDWVYEGLCLLGDMTTIQQIADETIAVKTFDYDGVKYKRGDADLLLSRLREWSDQFNERILEHDKRIYDFFRTREGKAMGTSKLEEMYRDFIEYDKEVDRRFEVYNEWRNSLQFVGEVTPYDVIVQNFSRFAPLEEKLREGMRKTLSDQVIQADISTDAKNALERYLSKDWIYFDTNRYYDDNLQVMYDAMNHYSALLSRGYFLRKMGILRYQESLVLSVRV